MNPLDVIYQQFNSIRTLSNGSFNYGGELMQSIYETIVQQGNAARNGQDVVEEQLGNQYGQFLSSGRYQKIRNPIRIGRQTNPDDLFNRFGQQLRDELDQQINNLQQGGQGQAQQILNQLNDIRQNIDNVLNNRATYNTFNSRVTQLHNQVSSARDVVTRVDDAMQSRNFVENLLVRISGGTLTLDQQYISTDTATRILDQIDYNQEFGQNADLQRMAGNALKQTLSKYKGDYVSPKSLYQDVQGFYQDIQKSRTIISNSTVINTAADKLNSQYNTIQQRFETLYQGTANPFTSAQVTEGDDVSRVIKNMFGAVQLGNNPKNLQADTVDRSKFINKLEGVTIPAGENNVNIDLARSQYQDFVLFRNTPANQPITQQDLSLHQQQIIQQQVARQQQTGGNLTEDQVIQGFRRNAQSSITDLFTAYGVQFQPTEKLVQQEKQKLEKQNVAGTQVDMFNRINQVIGTSQKHMRQMQQTTNVQEIQMISFYTQLGARLDQNNSQQYTDVNQQVEQALLGQNGQNRGIDQIATALQRDYEQQGFGNLNEAEVRTALSQWLEEDILPYGRKIVNSENTKLGYFLSRYDKYVQQRQQSGANQDVQRDIQNILNEIENQRAAFNATGDVNQFNRELARINASNRELLEMLAYMPDMYEDVTQNVAISLYSRLSKLPGIQGNTSALEQMNVFQNTVQQHTYYSLKTVGQFDDYMYNFLGPNSDKVRELQNLLPRTWNPTSTVVTEATNFQQRMKSLTTGNKTMLDQLRGWIQEETKSGEPSLVSDLIARLSRYQHSNEVANQSLGQQINQILGDLTPENEWFKLYQQSEQLQYQIGDVLNRKKQQPRNLKRELLDEIRQQFSGIQGGQEAYNEIEQQLNESANILNAGFRASTFHGAVLSRVNIAGQGQLNQLNEYANQLAGIQQFQYSFVDRQPQIGKGIMSLAISDVQKVLDKQANEPVYSLTVSILADQVRSKKPWTSAADIDYQTLSIFQTQFENPFLQHPELINKDYVNNLLAGSGMTFDSLSSPNLTDQGRKDFFRAMLYGMYKNVQQNASPNETDQQLFQRQFNEFLNVLKDDQQIIKTLGSSSDLDSVKDQLQNPQLGAPVLRKKRNELVQNTLQSFEYVHMLDQYSKQLGSQHLQLYDMVTKQSTYLGPGPIKNQPTLWQGIIAQQNITRQSLSPTETYKTVQFVRGNKGAEEQFNLLVSGELATQLKGGQYKRVIQALTGNKFTPALGIIDQMPTNIRTKMIDMLEKGRNQISNAKMEELQNIDQFMADPSGVFTSTTGLDDYTKYQGKAYASGFYVRGSGTENNSRAAIFISVPENPFARTPLYKTQSTERGIRAIQHYFFQPSMESELQTEQTLDFGGKLNSAQDLMYASYMGGQPIGFYKPIEHKENDFEFGTAFVNGYSYKIKNEQFREIGSQFLDQTYQSQLAMQNNRQTNTVTVDMLRTFERLRQLTLSSKQIRDELSEIYTLSNEILPTTQLNQWMTQKDWSMTVDQFQQLIDQFQTSRGITGQEAIQMLQDRMINQQTRLNSLSRRGRNLDVDILKTAQNMWSPTNLKVQGMNITVQPPNRQDYISLSTPNRPGQVQQFVPEKNVAQPTQEMLNMFQNVTDLIRAVNQYYQRAPTIRLLGTVDRALIEDRNLLQQINNTEYISQQIPNLETLSGGQQNNSTVNQDVSLLLPTMVISKSDEDILRSITGTQEILEGDMYMVSRKFRELFGYERVTSTGSTEVTRFSQEQTLKFVGPERSKGMQNVEFNSELYFQVPTADGKVQYVPVMLIMNEQPSRHNKLSQIGQGILRAQKFLSDLNYREYGSNQPFQPVNTHGVVQSQLTDVQGLQDAQMQLQNATTLPVYYRDKNGGYVSAGFNAQFIIHDLFTDISQENWQELKGGSIMYAQTFQQFQSFGIENLVSTIFNVDDPTKNQMFYIQNRNMQPFVQHGMQYQVVQDKVQSGQVRFDERYMNLESQYGMIYEGQQGQYKTQGSVYSLAGQLEPWNKTLGRYITSRRYQDTQPEQLNILQNQLSQYNSRGRLNTTADFIRTMQQQLQGSRETNQMGQNLVRLDVDTQRKLTSFIGQDIYMPDPIGGWLMELFSQTKTFARLENPEFKLSTDMLNVARMVNIQRKQGQYQSFEIQGQNLLFTRLTVDDFIKVEKGGIYLDLGAETLQNLFQGVYSFMYNSSAQQFRQMDLSTQLRDNLPTSLIKQKSRLADQQTEKFTQGLKFNQNRQLTFGQSVVSQFAKRFTKDQGVFITGLHSTQSNTQGGVKLPRHAIENILMGGQYFIQTQFENQIDQQASNGNTQLADQLRDMYQKFNQSFNGGNRMQAYSNGRTINNYTQERYQNLFSGYLHQQIYIDAQQGQSRVGQPVTISMINNRSTGINRTGLFENLRSTLVHLRPLLDQATPEEQVQFVDINDPTQFLQFQTNVYQQLEVQYQHFIGKQIDLDNRMNGVMNKIRGSLRAGDYVYKARLDVQRDADKYDFRKEQPAIGEMVGFLGRDPILGQTPFVRFVGLSENHIVVPKHVQDLIGGDDDADIVRYLPNIIISNRVYNDTYLDTLSSIMSGHIQIQNQNNVTVAGTAQQQALNNSSTSQPLGYVGPGFLTQTDIDMYRSDIGELIAEYSQYGWYIPINMNNRSTGYMSSMM